jgi:cell division septation protein DedD
MNEEDYPEKPSGFLFGKEFIIVLVIVFSGMSFTLGYFVGKNTAGTAANSLQAAEGIMQQNRPDLPSALPARAQPQPTETAPAVVPSQGISPESAPATVTSKQANDENAGTAPQEQLQAVVQQKHTPPVASGIENTAAKTAPESRSDEKNRLYAVQIGAFKSSEEAKQLKTRFEKKGYTSFVSVVKDKKGNKIYKVKTGEFSDKKDADVLALKLKKTEGLHTYVTTKSE